MVAKDSLETDVERAIKKGETENKKDGVIESKKLDVRSMKKPYNKKKVMLAERSERNIPAK